MAIQSSISLPVRAHLNPSFPLSDSRSRALFARRAPTRITAAKPPRSRRCSAARRARSWSSSDRAAGRFSVYSHTAVGDGAGCHGARRAAGRRPSAAETCVERAARARTERRRARRAEGVPRQCQCGRAARVRRLIDREARAARGRAQRSARPGSP